MSFMSITVPHKTPNTLRDVIATSNYSNFQWLKPGGINLIPLTVYSQLFVCHPNDPGILITIVQCVCAQSLVKGTEIRFLRPKFHFLKLIQSVNDI